MDLLTRDSGASVARHPNICPASRSYCRRAVTDAASFALACMICGARLFEAAAFAAFATRRQFLIFVKEAEPDAF